jgi:phage replication initiation protein
LSRHKYTEPGASLQGDCLELVPDPVPAAPIVSASAAPIAAIQPPWWEVIADYRARAAEHGEGLEWDEVAAKLLSASVRADGLPEGQAAAAAVAAPPLCRTGVQTPTECLVDSLRVTFPLDTTLETVCLLFGGSAGSVSLPHGYRHYKHAMLLRPGVTVLHGGRPEMGVHVEVSGAGCRQLEAEGVVECWQQFIARCLAFNGRFGRIDVAIDDRAGLLDMQQIEGAAWRGRCKGRQVLRDTDRDGVELGHTIYFGSRESDTFCRLYDKRLEQRAKGATDDSHWVRAELELKSERAHALAQVLAAGDLMATVAGVLRSHLVFVEPTADTHRERWPVCEWWLRFLAEAEKVKLKLKPAEGLLTIQRAHRWLTVAAGPVLAALMEHQQGSLEWLLDVITVAAARMKPKHQLLARAPYLDLAVRPMPSGSAVAA